MPKVSSDPVSLAYFRAPSLLSPDGCSCFWPWGQMSRHRPRHIGCTSRESPINSPCNLMEILCPIMDFFQPLMFLNFCTEFPTISANFAKMNLPFFLLTLCLHLLEQVHHVPLPRPHVPSGHGDGGSAPETHRLSAIRRLLQTLELLSRYIAIRQAKCGCTACPSPGTHA